MLTSQSLLDLTSTELPVLRDYRYDGGGFGVPMAEFAPEDQSILRHIYDSVQGLHVAWHRHEESEADLENRLKQFAAEDFLETALRLGVASAKRGKSPMARKAVHDVRGGGLTVLIGTAQLLDLGIPHGSQLKACVSIARDHAKIMRNAISDIDPATRDADEAAKPHGIKHFLDKWEDAEVRIADKAIRVAVRCEFDGDISARCLETSAIDRILYNYVNNAARFTNDGLVAMTIFSVGKEVVRWVVSNSIGSEQRAWLEANVGADLKPLFRGGMTHGGQGIGLSNCADFIAAAFGLKTPADAIERAYLGAKVVGDHYHAWFHWPTYTPPTSVLA